jgi:predicted Zn-dependent protease
VNNAAHVGGLIAGLILGAVLRCVLRGIGETSSQPDLSQRPLSFGDPPISRAEDLRLATVAIIAAVTLVAGAFGLAKHNATIAQYGAAVALIRENDPAAAIPKLQNSIARDPNNALSLEMLGILLLDQGDAAQAWPVLRRAVDLDPNDLALRHNLALAYMGAGLPEYAPKEIGWALKSGAENKAAANFILGVSSYRVENYSDAEKYLRQAIEDRKDFFEAQNVLGAVYSAMGKRTEAHDQYAAVLAGHPKDLVAAGGLQVLTTLPKGPVPPDELPRFVIPYSKLIAKSEYWPLFP